LLHGEEGKLSLAATDMEISIRASLEGDVEGDASVVVPGRLLTDLVRLLPDESVTLAYDEGEGVLSVASGKHASRLNVYSAEDFRDSAARRPLQKIDAAASWPPSRRSAARLRETSHGRPDRRPGPFEGDQLIMAATDSYRLA
jgi:DNA polymerase-3 subunit beta